MLNLVEGQCAVSIARTEDIKTATDTFKKAVLTPREVAWYRGISTAKLISSKIEALVEAAEKMPWRLLNLPEETLAQKERRNEQIRANERRAVEVEKALRKLVVRDGEGIYNPDMQVVSMDGFTAAKTQDVEKMTKPQLIAISKVAIAKGYFSKAEIKDLKVKELRAKIIEYVKKYPEAIQIPGAAVSNSTVADETSTQNASITEPETAGDDVETVVPKLGNLEDAAVGSDLLVSCAVVEVKSRIEYLLVSFLIVSIGGVIFLISSVTVNKL